ncbi:MAG: DegT/DnrJ/EryC1/StrS family aminotransferase [Myxococcales bacterium]
MILMNDFKRHVDLLHDELQAAMERVLRSGWFVLGKEVEAFEREFADYVGAPFAVGVANGMDALQLGLMAWDIGPGDEVITTPNSAFASTLAILRVGATPVFVDIDERSYALDARLVRGAITERTRAILPVHIYGRAAELESLAELASQHGLMLLNDACQAHGATYRGRSIPSFGDAAAYSFYPTKNLGCFGDGGMIVCSDAARHARLRSLRDYGQAKRYHHLEAGLNSRLDELQAAVLRVKLAHLRAHTERRRAIASKYIEGLSGLPLVLPQYDAEAVWHLFVVRTPQRDALSKFLASQDVQSLVHYPVLIPAQPAIHSSPAQGRASTPIPYTRGSLPVAERCADEFLSLPIHAELSDVEVERVCQAVRAYFERA